MSEFSFSYDKLDSTQSLTIINVNTNASVFKNAKEKERDSWHKLWLYCFIAVYPVLILLIILILRLAKSESLRKYIPPPKLKR